MVQELSQDNLAEIVSDNQKVVVQFSASWCGNCRIMKPKFKKLSSENEDVAFVIVDAEKFPESRKLADVSNLPTFATFVDGKFLNQTQTNKFDVLKDLVNQVI
ncbi:Thioredoxin [Polaribacter sp. Hel1_33_78]|jgi:thioredoxin 1|uniref:thioredoxin family protein n=1 Tax=unclassified Polaribacter TaxID=196858 RepID=UPI00052C1E52|nr:MULTISPECIES: thioredoxin family protein [unclassified Polaribacter]MBT3741570.1 thioredoxin family protein [Polaribacter sp.]KGL60367.1 thioredoxin [Polaribacter sp. Hel1_33_49]MBT4414297.1 thioredoxin family protein [Polaribacter sp.]MBT7815823.1 thioredoxin family protein [Polaribacter sp.]MDG2436499.1 thioredoxin family protein [Polaribacter sp.]